MTALVLKADDKYGRWTVIACDQVKSKKEGQTWYRCHCVCGTKRSVKATRLVCKKTRSCGCLSVDKLKQRSSTHGASRTIEYKSWISMIERCCKPWAIGYGRYGGRGIRVCRRWRNSFENFYSDMGPRTSTNYSIDRIDTDGHYCPDNCRWATRQQQQNNRRDNRLVTYKGRSQTIAAWQRELGVKLKESTIRMRLDVYGWTVERAL